MGLFGKKKKDDDDDIPEDEVSEALEEAGFFSNNESSGSSNEEEALLNQYFPGGGGDLNLNFDDDEKQEEDSLGIAGLGDSDEDGSGLDDDLMSIFTDEEVSDQDMSVLTEGLQEVEIKSLLSDLQDVAARLRNLGRV